MWEYFKVTGDDSLLLEGGAEVILECARFYYSYAWFKKEKNRFEILDVIGPDEYHERVNNNAFTSMVAKATIEIANATVAHLKRKHPAALSTSPLSGRQHGHQGSVELHRQTGTIGHIDGEGHCAVAARK